MLCYFTKGGFFYSNNQLKVQDFGLKKDEKPFERVVFGFELYILNVHISNQTVGYNRNKSIFRTLINISDGAFCENI